MASAPFRPLHPSWRLLRASHVLYLGDGADSPQGARPKLIASLFRSPPRYRLSIDAPWQDHHWRSPRASRVLYAGDGAGGPPAQRRGRLG
jgi:hypothetical protein